MSIFTLKVETILLNEFDEHIPKKYFTKMDVSEIRGLKYRNFVWIEMGENMVPKKVSKVDNDNRKIMFNDGGYSRFSNLYKLNSDGEEYLTKDVLGLSEKEDSDRKDDEAQHSNFAAAQTNPLLM